MAKCLHGVEIGPQNAQADIDSWKGIGNEDQILDFYSACDCCDYLMHKDYADMEPPNGYQVCEDGRTLCSACREDLTKTE